MGLYCSEEIKTVFTAEHVIRELVDLIYNKIKKHGIARIAYYTPRINGENSYPECWSELDENFHKINDCHPINKDMFMVALNEFRKYGYFIYQQLDEVSHCKGYVIQGDLKNKYSVTITDERSAIVEVEASFPEEAKEIAFNIVNKNDALFSRNDWNAGVEQIK